MHVNINEDFKNYYLKQKEEKSKVVEQLSSNLRIIGITRFIVFIILLLAFYFNIKTPSSIYIIIGFICIFLFFYLVYYHNKKNKQLNFESNLLKINQDEIAFLEQSICSFPTGIEHKDETHPYTYDLDIFGANSLYNHICRASTYHGKEKLAKWFKKKENNETILANQECIKELGNKIEWRQSFNALGLLNEDTKTEYENLQRWLAIPADNISIVNKILAYLLPACFFLVLVYSIFLGSLEYFSWINSLFIANLVCAGFFFKKIKEVISLSTNLSTTINKNAQLLNSIESQNFASPKLQKLQNKGSQPLASEVLMQLSSIFATLDTALNPMGTILMNGSMQIHVHANAKLQNWKKTHSSQIEVWLHSIGEIDALNSLANFAYNNPDFTFPKINTEQKISFKSLGHPLINRKKRVCNDVSFTDNRFILLTGSNMSGKSTFLRCLGVDMVLAGMGSVIASNEANIHPMDIFVSMRQTDDLNSGESYFFAEVKRLQQIIEASKDETHFILLDEILKGTNSDDKRFGTLGVIERMVNLNSIGALATHDIEVCAITDKYPTILTNKCFESEIIDNELHFDYKLRDGICKNKSATFIMKKMGVI